MIQSHVRNTKRVRLYKDGPVLDTPDHASWRPRSMTNPRCEDNSTDDVVCPACGRGSPTHQGYAVHYSKSHDGEHTGNPTIARFGRDRLIALYWEYSYEEIADILNIGSTTVANTYDELNLPKKTEYNRVAWEHGVSKTRLAHHLHYDAEMTTSEMSDALGVSRTVIDNLFEKSEVNPRTQGEAAKLVWERAGDDLRKKVLTPEFREQQQEEGISEELREWMEENNDKMAEYAALGAPAREENGMKGRTGQDNPNWRGGKHLVDALRKQLRPSWWTVRDGERADECYKCGASECKLDVHHIVPLSAGGTNDSWNLMTLCESCHPTAESYVRQFEAFDPVLTE